MSSNQLAQDAKLHLAQFAIILNNQHEVKAKFIAELVASLEKVQKATDIVEMQKQIDSLEEEIAHLKIDKQELEEEVEKLGSWAEEARYTFDEIWANAKDQHDAFPNR